MKAEVEIATEINNGVCILITLNAAHIWKALAGT